MESLAPDELLTQEALDFIEGKRSKTGRPSNELRERVQQLEKAFQTSKVLELISNPEIMSKLESSLRLFSTSLDENKGSKVPPDGTKPSIFQDFITLIGENSKEGFGDLIKKVVPITTLITGLWLAEDHINLPTSDGKTQKFPQIAHGLYNIILLLAKLLEGLIYTVQAATEWLSGEKFADFAKRSTLGVIPTITLDTLTGLF